MEHIRIDRSRKPEVGRQRNRHGPSTRGDPDIRGKPPDVYHPEQPVPIPRDSRRISVILSSLSRYLGIVEGSLSNEVATESMRFPIELGMTARGKPGYWLHRNRRDLTAKNSVGFFGNFIPNGNYFAREEVTEWVSWFPNRDYKCAKCLPYGSQGIRTTRMNKVDIQLLRHASAWRI